MISFVWASSHNPMTVLLLLLNLALIGAFSAFVLACAKVHGRIAYVVGGYLISYADIVIILELAGVLSAIHQVTVLVFQLSLTTISALVWIRMAKPLLFRPFLGPKLQRLDIPGLVGIARQAPVLSALLILLAGSAGYVYFRHAEQILVVPPNNWDSLTYHLSRVGYWLQYKSFYPWPSAFLHQTTLPMNAELGLLWTILWRGTDQLTGFVQWTTVPVIVLGIYGIVCQLGYGRGQAALVAMLWPTLTQVLYQSSTTQNDLLTTAFWVATLYFFFASARKTGGPYPYLSGLALGLAIGTKSTSFLVLPGLACGSLLFMWLRRGDKEIRILILRWMAASLLSVFLFGSYIFLQNSVAFGSALGPMGARRGPGDLATVDLSSPDLVPTLSSLLRDNLGRYIYQLVDFSPLPLHVASTINPLKSAVFSSIFQRLHIRIENAATVWTDPFSLRDINYLSTDRSWFGPLGAVLILAVVYQSYAAVRRRDALRLTLVLVTIGFLAFHSMLQLWTPANGRYYLIPVTVAFPLMADFLDTRTPWRGVLASLLVLLGLTVMFNVTLMDRVLQQVNLRNVHFGVRQAPAWANEFDYRIMAENVPLNASIGVVSARDFRDYPFFGEHFTRRVTLAIPEDAAVLPKLNPAPFASAFQQSDYLFIVGTSSRFIPDLALRSFDLLSVHNSDSFWIRDDLRTSSDCDDDKWPFTDFFRSSFPQVCAQFPIFPGSIADGFRGALYLDDGRFKPQIGSSSQAMLKFSLLVKQPTRANIAVRVAATEGTVPTLQLVLSAERSQPVLFSAPFSAVQSLTFQTNLLPGVYNVQLHLENGVSARIQTFRVLPP